MDEFCLTLSQPVMKATRPLTQQSFYSNIRRLGPRFYFDLDGKWDVACSTTTLTVHLHRGDFVTVLDTLVTDTVNLIATTSDRVCGEGGLVSIVWNTEKRVILHVRVDVTAYMNTPRALQQWEEAVATKVHVNPAVLQHNKEVYRQVLKIKLKPLKKRLARLQQEMQDLKKDKRKKKDKYHARICECDTKQKVVEHL